MFLNLQLLPTNHHLPKKPSKLKILHEQAVLLTILLSMVISPQLALSNSDSEFVDTRNVDEVRDNGDIDKSVETPMDLQKCMDKILFYSKHIHADARNGTKNLRRIRKYSRKLRRLVEKASITKWTV